ncbi:MAG: DUF4235 domain-containing protein [Nitriliruptorales bacterium]|nr:DUF4235 domain-containing protein [Nitriliruptorales bacterium]
MDKDTLWKVAAGLASVAAGLAARNAATSLWRRRRGVDPPANPADPSTGWGEAIAWTMFVGATVGLARLFARRGAAGLWESVEDELPPALHEVDA